MANLQADLGLPSEDAKLDTGIPISRPMPYPSVELHDILSIDQNVAWLDTINFDQIVLMLKEDHALGLIKGHKGRLPYVSYLATPTYANTLQAMGEFASKGLLTWYIDKWPSKRVKALLRA